MSEIYTDGAGNKYLGDCRWGNHNISYPTYSYLLSAGPLNPNDYRLELAALLEAKGYTSVVPGVDWINSQQISWGSGWTWSPYYNFIEGVSPLGTTLKLGSQVQSGGNSTRRIDLASCGGELRQPAPSQITSTYLQNLTTDVTTNINYQSAIAFDQGFAFLAHSLNVPGNSYGSSYFLCLTRLVDVNPNFNYYTASTRFSSVFLHAAASISFGSSPNNNLATAFNHYIVSSRKDLLQTGRAVYTIECSDGQLPGTQWATDMWVYDNNEALGFPVIGRVPNMLLGVGSYTYLKPVRIQGTAYPDEGSPWYLPVGVFAGKTLLMRCYSSVT